MDSGLTTRGGGTVVIDSPQFFREVDNKRNVTAIPNAYDASRILKYRGYMNEDKKKLYASLSSITTDAMARITYEQLIVWANIVDKVDASLHALIRQYNQQFIRLLIANAKVEMGEPRTEVDEKALELDITLGIDTSEDIPTIEADIKRQALGESIIDNEDMLEDTELITPAAPAAAPAPSSSMPMFPSLPSLPHLPPPLPPPPATAAAAITMGPSSSSSSSSSIVIEPTADEMEAQLMRDLDDVISFTS